MKAFITTVLLALILAACSAEKESAAVYQLPANDMELLAGQELKTWKLARRTNDKMRVNMNECTLAYRQTFSRVSS